MASDDDSTLPSAKECQSRIDRFVEFTNTDEALAQFYLQDRNWDVERSVKSYFSENPPEKASNHRTKRQKVEDPLDMNVPMHELTFMTWNLDGLDPKNLKNRTHSVIETILERQTDIVLLQEVINVSYEIFRQELNHDYLITEKRGISNQDYYTVILLKRKSVKMESLEVKPYEGTMMARDLMVAEVKVNGKEITLLNTHLESTKDFAQERMRQLKTCFDFIKKADQDKTVILGGDLNIRDEEVEKVGIPENTVDVWIETGSRKEVRYTWDMTRNHNKEFPGKFKPRCRFDRVYLRRSQNGDVKADHFGLCGIQKVKGCQVFPSDHWGIFCIFKLT